MVLGLSLSAFTQLHVAISLIAILTGCFALWGMLAGKKLVGWTDIFLLTTILTSVTGLMFPLSGITPAFVVGVISLGLLALAVAALYAFQLSGAWRTVYVATAVTSLYLNVFVLVAQGFQKLPVLHGLAPTQSEPPFAIAELIVLGAFIALGVLAYRRFAATV
jgi:hypothetical protein